MNAVDTKERCTHCDSPIVDPTSRVVHGGRAYCCTNCANAMEQQGAGSDPHAGAHENDLRCAHCESPIVDESTLEERGDEAFCCANCLYAAHPDAALRGT